MAALTYLSRRFSRVAPIALVTTLVTMLLVFVTTPTNTFYETTRANIAALRAFTVVAPARSPEFDSTLVRMLDGNAAIASRVPVKALWVRYPMIVGEAYCPLILADARQARILVERSGLRLVSGRFPDEARPGVVLHEGVARARSLAIGSRFGTWVDPEDTTPGAFEVVGLLRGDARLAVGTPGSGLLLPFVMARVPSFALLYPEPGAKAHMDSSLHEARVGDQPAFQVIDEAYMTGRALKALANVPILSNFIALSTSLIVALIVALLALVASQGRQEEFAILLAIGRRRSWLLGRLALEAAVLGTIAWLIGITLGMAGLYAYDHFVFQPRGLLVRIDDPRAIWVSAMLPLVSVTASVLALGWKLVGMDPVAILQRRGS